MNKKNESEGETRPIFDPLSSSLFLFFLFSSSIIDQTVDRKKFPNVESETLCPHCFESVHTQFQCHSSLCVFTLSGQEQVRIAIRELFSKADQKVFNRHRVRRERREIHSLYQSLSTVDDKFQSSGKMLTVIIYCILLVQHLMSEYSLSCIM